MIRFKLPVKEARKSPCTHPFPDRAGSLLFRIESAPPGNSHWEPGAGMLVDEGDTWGPLVTHNEFLFVSSLLLALAMNNYTYNLILVLDRGESTD